MARLLENQSNYFDEAAGITPQPLYEGVHTSSNPVNLGIGGTAQGSNSEVGPNAGVQSGIARYKQMTIPLVRRIFPELLANQLVGVQAMNGPVGLAYAMRFRDESNNELGYNHVDETYTSATTAGKGYSLAQGEQLDERSGDLGSLGLTTMREVGLTVEQKEIVARTCKLKLRWSIEA
jgi:hypothetical protein